jgi:hypothetical protein
MDRPRVAAIIREMLEPGGAFIQVADVKEPLVVPDEGLPFSSPPHDAIRELVRRYLGPIRRAGQGVLRFGSPGDEADVLRDAGFPDPARIRVPAGNVLVRTAGDVVAWVFSHSGSAPHLFGEQRDEFEHDLRRLLDEASPSGRFAEVQPDTEVFVWRKT